MTIKSESLRSSRHEKALKLYLCMENNIPFNRKDFLNDGETAYTLKAIIKYLRELIEDFKLGLIITYDYSKRTYYFIKNNNIFPQYIKINTIYKKKEVI